MARIIPKATIPYRISAKYQSMVDYYRFRRECIERAGQLKEDVPGQEEINALMKGYPRNHEYQVINGCVVPKFKLYERLRLVTQAYSSPLQSFLDIGCCRGFYVLDAATRLQCPLAVGIDVYEPFVSKAQKVAEHLGAGNAHFHFASLEEISEDPKKFGGPFQTIMLIGTYHYLYWGSGRCKTAYHSHDEILNRLASICTEKLIFSGRITVDRLPEGVRQNLTRNDSYFNYTPEALLQSAEKFFNVRQIGFLGTYPLLTMAKR
jgi:hypothetical protein